MEVYRIQQLAAGLRRCGEYGWKFEMNHMGIERERRGCAAGLCTVLFPDAFFFGKYGGVRLRANGDIGTYHDAMEAFFGFADGVSWRLFNGGRIVTANELADELDALIAPHLAIRPRCSPRLRSRRRPRQSRNNPQER